MLWELFKKSWKRNHPATRAGAVLGLLTAVSFFFFQAALDRGLPDHPTPEQENSYLAWFCFGIIMICLHIIGLLMMFGGTLIRQLQFRQHKKQVPGG